MNLVINSKAGVDTEEVTLTNAPLIVDGRTLTRSGSINPAWFGVEWNPETRTATITAGSKKLSGTMIDFYKQYHN